MKTLKNLRWTAIWIFMVWYAFTDSHPSAWIGVAFWVIWLYVMIHFGLQVLENLGILPLFRALFGSNKKNKRERSSRSRKYGEEPRYFYDGVWYKSFQDYQKSSK